MKEYKGVQYPDLNDALDFYQVPANVGGFNKDERLCTNLLIKLPKSRVILSIDGVNKDSLFKTMNQLGHIPANIADNVNKQIDSVCRNYIDAIMSGDLEM